jgi:Antitoxin VbhA
MSQTPKDTRTAAEKARDTAGIVGSLKHEGYVPTPEAEAVHQRAARGEITSEEAIKIFRDRAVNQDAELTSSNPQIDNRHAFVSVRSLAKAD